MVSAKKSKKNPNKKPTTFTIENCTFHGVQESSEAEQRRIEAVKALADALGKAAEALLGPRQEAPLLQINPPKS